MTCLPELDCEGIGADWAFLVHFWCFNGVGEEHMISVAYKPRACVCRHDTCFTFSLHYKMFVIEINVHTCELHLIGLVAFERWCNGEARLFTQTECLCVAQGILSPPCVSRVSPV